MRNVKSSFRFEVIMRQIQQRVLWNLRWKYEGSVRKSRISLIIVIRKSSRRVIRVIVKCSERALLAGITADSRIRNDSTCARCPNVNGERLEFRNEKLKSNSHTHTHTHTCNISYNTGNRILCVLLRWCSLHAPHIRTSITRAVCVCDVQQLQLSLLCLFSLMRFRELAPSHLNWFRLYRTNVFSDHSENVEVRRFSFMY